CEPWRPGARSYPSPGITGAAGTRFRTPDSGPARGTFAAARHQRPVGAKPLWRGFVAASALPVGGALAEAIVASSLVAFVEPLSMPRRKLTLSILLSVDPVCCIMANVRKADLQLVAYRFGNVALNLSIRASRVIRPLAVIAGFIEWTPVASKRSMSNVT